jgi:hypothetical protein
MTSVYDLALGMIDPMTFLHRVGIVNHTAVEAQKPAHRTESQIDHQIWDRSAWNYQFSSK